MRFGTRLMKEKVWTFLSMYDLIKLILKHLKTRFSPNLGHTDPYYHMEPLGKEAATAFLG